MVNILYYWTPLHTLKETVTVQTSCQLFDSHIPPHQIDHIHRYMEWRNMVQVIGFSRHLNMFFQI